MSERAKRTRTLFAMIWLNVLSVAMLLVLPAIVASSMDRLGFSAQDAGLLTAADMGGAFVSAIVVSTLIKRGRWRSVLTWATGTLAVCDVGSALVTTVSSLCACRAVAGVAEGVLLAITNAAIGGTANPDRVFGMATASQLGFGAVFLFFAPALGKAWGWGGAFVVLAAFSLCSLMLVRWMPDALASDEALPAGRHSRPEPLRSALGLAGVLAFFAGQGAVWTYVERIGAQDALSAETISAALSASSVSGLVGALLASWLGLRLGRVKPIVLSGVCSAVCMVVLSHKLQMTVFAVATCFFNLAWNYSVPYQFGTLAQIDASGRTVAAGSAVIFAGLTAGPLLAGGLVREGAFGAANWIGVGFTTLSVAMFMIVLRRRKDEAREVFARERG